MAKLKDDIKRMLSALAYQDADEYLSSYDKMKVLGYGTEANTGPAVAERKYERRSARPHIALVIDSQGSAAALSYTIDACQRQNAQIDLLLHGAIDTKIIALIEQKISNAGLLYSRIQLSVNAVEDMIDYIFSQSTLIYLVSMSDDTVVRELIEEVLPKRAQTLPVPLVFMNSDKPASRKKRSAA